MCVFFLCEGVCVFFCVRVCVFFFLCEGVCVQHSCYLFVLTCSRALAVCRTIDRATPLFMCFAASHHSIDHHGQSSETAAS